MRPETAKIVSEVEAFLAQHGIAESTFGLRAVNDGKLLARLRAGGSLTLEKAAQVRRYIRANRKKGAAIAAPVTESGRAHVRPHEAPVGR